MAEGIMEWSSRDAREEIGPGSIVMDGWELKEPLGKGNFSDVWLAEKTLLGINYQSAIKIIRIPRDPADIDVMRAEGFSDANIQAELRRKVEKAVQEVRTMIDLRTHFSIVLCESFDVIQYEADGTWEIDIRMQRLNPLINWATTQGVRPEDVIRMGISLSDLLSVCENKNILHRDIKPANIFVDQMNQFKLGDFGLARVISDSGSVHSKDVGTEAFMAPEVFNGSEYDQRADVYSLGLVMYWLLNNQRLPFVNGSSSRSQAIVRRLSGEALPVLPGTDPALDQVIRKACDPNPNKRWKTASEFHDALLHLSVPVSPEKKKINWKRVVPIIAVIVLLTGGFLVYKNPSEQQGGGSEGSHSYTITWKDDSGKTIDTMNVADGEMPYHYEPSKSPDEQYTYTFSGWTPEIEKVSGNATYTAVFDRWERSYNITWKDDSGKTIDTTNVKYGEMPYHYEPSKQPDSQYTYTFSKWMPEIEKVSGKTTYTAVFDKWQRTYTITWKDDSGKTIDTTTVAYGEMPYHYEPSKSSDELYTYTFSGWAPEIEEVSGNTTYTAIFDNWQRTYTVTWKDDSGKTIDTTTVAYGEKPYHYEPSKQPDSQYTYTFSKWTPEIRTVTGDATYTAIFIKTSKTQTTNPWPVKYLNKIKISFRESKDNRFQSYGGPNTSRYSQVGAFEPNKKTSIYALFEEDGYIYADIDCQNFRRCVYFHDYDLVNTTGVQTQNLTYYSAKTTQKCTPRYGPGMQYDKVVNRKTTSGITLSSGKRISVFFEMDNWVFTEFDCDIGTVRAWLPEDQVTK